MRPVRSHYQAHHGGNTLPSTLAIVTLHSDAKVTLNDVASGTSARNARPRGCAVHGITLEKPEDRRMVKSIPWPLSESIPACGRAMSYVVRIKGIGTKQQFAEIHRVGDGDPAQFLQRVPACDP
jgi:hypothetical protein